MGTANVKRKYPDDRAREVFEAAKSGDAVLLSDILQEMNSSERTSALETKMDASLRYGVNEYETFKVTPLIVAAKNGNVECVKVLLNYKADIEGRGGDDEDDGRGVKIDRKYSCRGCTPLIVASTYGNLNVLSCLIANGADVNARSKYNCTPLMIASRYGHVNVVTFLIEHGANMDLKDKTGKTALHYAVRYYRTNLLNSFGVLSCLIKRGADVNAPISKELCTLLMIASQNHNVDLVTFLIDHGANIDLQDKKGKTAIHHAVDSCDILSCLIRNGADVNACTKSNCTPLMIASLKGNMSAVTILLEHGANMDQQDKNGDTALHYAVDNNSSKVVYKKLLSLGAPQLCNSQGLTPLLLASNECNISVVENLITRPEYTKEQRVDALELLGASLAAHQDSQRGFGYIKCGMEERFADPSRPLFKQSMEPVEAYQNRKECQTLEELAQIEHDRNAIIMEGLTIRERILGTNNAELLGPIQRVAQYYYNDGIVICVGLYKHAMKLARHCNQSAFSDLKKLTSLLSYKGAWRDLFPKEEAFLELLEQTIFEYEKQQKMRRLSGFEFELLFDSTMELVLTIAKLKYCKDGKSSCVLVLLKRLCCLNPRNELGDTLLHKALELRSTNSFLCLDTVKLLLNAGLIVNTTNNNGDTPLHVAVTFVPSSDEIHLLTDMLEVLLDGGAHHDFVDNDGKTPMDMAATDEACMILSNKRTPELKCISARAVKKFGLHYLGVVPKILEKYISMH